MSFLDRQQGWIVGSESTPVEADPAKGSRTFRPFILRTVNGGETWEEIDVGPLLRSQGAEFTAFFDICSDRSGTAWIVGNAGIVEATIEADALRTSQVTMTGVPLHDLSCNDLGEVWAVGEHGLIMHYQQKKWASSQYPDNNAFFNKVRVVGTSVWLVGGTHTKGEDAVRGLLLNSRNGGAWENRTPGDAGLLGDLSLTDNEGWLVGAQGSIYHTKDGGAAWQKAISPTENHLFSIFFLDAKRGWVGGDKLTVLGLHIN